MNQERIGKYIKDIRKKNNLTQQELADKLGVSFQAVSKWERGICLPDIYVLREISKLFNVNIEDILDADSSKDDITNKKDGKIKKYYIVGGIVLIIILILFIIFNNGNRDFEFKQISTSCDNFNITGSMAYNKDKTSLYISSIEFCGSDGNQIYQSIGCTLYEDHEGIENEISSCSIMDNISLEEYLKDVKISVDNYTLSCKNMPQSELYLEINATMESNKEIVYKIPITLMENSCSN